LNDISSVIKGITLSGTNSNVPLLPGLENLWGLTVGDPAVCIAILDGPVDCNHPSLMGASLTVPPAISNAPANNGPACNHGTRVASIIFAQHGQQSMSGIAPNCRGLIVPIFSDGPSDSIKSCSQSELASAILMAADLGALIINISAGELATTRDADPSLLSAARQCEERGILIVAAVGNDGCACGHWPSLFPSVLAVGATDSLDVPLTTSNWAPEFKANGILAPGHQIMSATCGGGYGLASGTSFACATVSGIAGLIVSLQVQRGETPDPRRVKALLLATAKRSCSHSDMVDQNCDHHLGGLIQIDSVVKTILTESDMSGDQNVQISQIENVSEPAGPMLNNQTISSPRELNAARVLPSGCDCATSAPPQFAFPIGRIGYDFTNVTNKSAFKNRGLSNPDDRVAMFEYLEKEIAQAENIIWTLEVDGDPIYAIQPQGAFSREIYQRLIEFLGDQEAGVIINDKTKKRSGDKAERSGLPGVVSGQRNLFSAGKAVEVLYPAYVGMNNWNNEVLVKAALEAYEQETPETAAASRSRGGAAPPPPSKPTKQDVLDFLAILYERLRNDGKVAADRALNFVATNLGPALSIFAQVLKHKMTIEDIQVSPSPIRPSGTERYDVVLSFFDPNDQLGTATVEYPITVDVNYLVPQLVAVGPKRPRSLRLRAS
jgi:hypothetical protein